MNRKNRSFAKVALIIMMTLVVPIVVARAAPIRSLDDQDDVVRRGVERALRDLDTDDTADIRVRVGNGIVWLTGSVPAWQGNAERLHAVRSVTGVRSIMNELRVVALNADRR